MEIQEDPLILYIIRKLGHDWDSLPRETEFETAEDVYATEYPKVIDGKAVKIYISKTYSRISWYNMYYEIDTRGKYRYLYIGGKSVPQSVIESLLGKNLQNIIDAPWAEFYKVDKAQSQENNDLPQVGISLQLA
jgi:hypothetical protein